MIEYTGNDIYCDLIIPRKIPVEVIKETDNIIAFYHTKPHWPVHIVVTPKRHIASLLELPSESDGFIRELLETVTGIARKVQDEQGACRVVTNLGDYQDSKHLHIHLGSGKANK